MVLPLLENNSLTMFFLFDLSLLMLLILHSTSTGRRPRTRARVSPTTPYSVLTPEGSRATARTLTYTGNSSAAEAAHESLGASVSGEYRLHQA